MFLINTHLAVLKLNPPKFSAIKAHQTSAGVYTVCTELERLQKQGDMVANRSVVEQRADHGKKSRDKPFSTPFCLYIFENALKNDILLPTDKGILRK